MDGFAAVDFGFAGEMLQRGTAALYLVAFVSTLNQVRPLLGERGLLPAPELLAWAASSTARKRALRPTLFTRIRYTDGRLAALCWTGIVISYRYRFAARAEHRAGGAVWGRDRQRVIVRPVSLPA
ncbi:hypothetical protein ACTU6V_00330 [Microbacterium sp. A204]|uniref:hypothetical protein n=1 Tax=Microbacterium sp. A204 TaxID=3457321 RepID=UPI003FCF8B62